MARRNAERGNAILEFAVSFSVLWMLFTGIFDWGYTLYLYNGLQTSVVNASRAASRMDLDGGDPTAFETAVKNLVVYGNTAGTGTAVVPNLTTAKVFIDRSPSSSTIPPKTITVSVSGYTYSAMFRTVTFTNKPLVTMPYIGDFTVDTSGGGGGGGGGKKNK